MPLTAYYYMTLLTAPEDSTAVLNGDESNILISSSWFSCDFKTANFLQRLCIPFYNNSISTSREHHAEIIEREQSYLKLFAGIDNYEKSVQNWELKYDFMLYLLSADTVMSVTKSVCSTSVCFIHRLVRSMI